ncbi:nucleotidyltransferase domain-containing protein [Butyrivibrio sp. AE3009]|uniref:nucleotidyltransferase domain-containing protein n=1 Tax=Butyrivibrio sp. AE3009 TaxID=1280666 RepID=UPI0018CB7F1D|nr:nucleotidyltransferase family protein [Butyrivibrio sp. AE3009]
MMDSNYSTIRTYTSELIRACFEKRKPLDIPKELTAKKLLDISVTGQMQYPIASSLLKLEIGEEEAQRAKDYLKLSTFKTFTQMMAANRITAEFEKEGIRHQLLKGAVTKSLYPSPEMREMSDIDLVVYDESLDKAAAVMEKLGYTNHGLIKHHMIFTDPNKVHVEVHWCLFDENADHKQHVYFKDNFKAKLKEGTEYTYEFSPEDFYIYMISHMSKHFFETGCGVRNLLDIYVYRNKLGDKMDNAYLVGELEKLGIKDFEEHMRKLAYIWMDNKECPEFFESLFAYMIDSGIYGKNENGVWSQLAKEVSQEGQSIKLHYYFPSLKFMQEKYPCLKKMPFLLPGAWIVRALTAACSKESRNHRKEIEGADKKEVDRMLDMYHRLNLNFRK